MDSCIHSPVFTQVDGSMGVGRQLQPTGGGVSSDTSDLMPLSSLNSVCCCFFFVPCSLFLLFATSLPTGPVHDTGYAVRKYDSGASWAST